MPNKLDFSDTNLGKHIDLLELLFARMPMGVAILDRAYHILCYNPAWAEFSNRYAPPGSVPLAKGINYFDHIPGSEEAVLPLYERVLNGETTHQNGLKLKAGGITTYWDGVLAPLEEKGEITGILSISIDVTERIEAQQQLESKVQERTEEINNRIKIAESLRGIISVLNSSQSLQDTLSFITKEACQILKSEACLIHHIQNEDNFVAIEASHGLPEELQNVSGFPLYSSPQSDDKILNLEPVWVEDFTKRKSVSKAEKDALPPEIKKWRELTNQYYNAWLAVPLGVQGEVYGSMAFYYASPQKFNEELVTLSQSFADQAALAIENARLYKEEKERLKESERRRRVAEELGKILAVLNSNRSLDEILEYVSSQAQQLTEADASVIYMLDLGDKTIQLIAGCQLPEKFSDLGILSFTDSSAYETISQANYYLAEDVQELYASYSDEVPLLTALVLEYYRAALLVPVIISGVVYGAIALFYTEPKKFTDEEIRLAASFADQAALAIENAHLRLNAEQTAIAAERNRLARDLHDAVTQTLFSASMIADVLPKIWERNPGEGQRRLEELRHLTRGALSEMRTLLVELRPAALEDTNLKDLVQHQINAFTARTGIAVDFMYEGDFEPAPQIKEMFYRIAQEALNNIAKHADAASVTIQLSCQEDQIEINIVDDGNGFDYEKIEHEGLGFGIMRERAANASGMLEIHSQIGKGTRLRVIWPEENNEEHISNE